MSCGTILAATTFALATNGETESEAPAVEGEDLAQARAVLTVSEGKRLIGKAVARMPIVQEALREGMVIIARGTTNTYVAEEILGKKIEHGALVTGKTYPTKGGKRLENETSMDEVILVNGEVVDDLPFTEAVQKLAPGDVVIKGANALDYESQTAGVLIGAGNSGTTGTFMPYLVARKSHLVIPVGLEKQVAGNVIDVANELREPVESLNGVPSMFFLTGHIVTEIEAIEALTGVCAFQAAAGGIGGAEGAIWLVFRGGRTKVEEALDLINEIQGEPSFVG